MRGITPSDLRPAWTVTQSESISITVPVTMAPGFMSISVRDCSNSSAKFSLIGISNIFNKLQYTTNVNRNSPCSSFTG